MVSKIVKSPKLKRAASSHIFELDDLDVGNKTSEQPQCRALAHATASVSALARTTGVFTKLHRDVEEILTALETATSNPPAVHQVAVLLQLQGYHAFVRRATGPRGVDGCLRTLRHSFIIVTDLSSSKHDATAIVDIAFREHFLLASSTPDYDSFLQAIPSIYVGTLGVLQPMITTASAAMASTYRTLGISIPPWRSASALMTKFQPVHFVDETCNFDGMGTPGSSSTSSTVAGSPGTVISPCLAATSGHTPPSTLLEPLAG